MNEVLFIIIGAVAGLGIGYVVLVAVRKKQLESEKSRILEEAKMQGENLKKERIMEAKEKYMQLRSEYEKDTNKRNQELSNGENRIKQKEQSVEDRLRIAKSKEEEAQQRKQRLDVQIESYKKREGELTEMREQQLKQLGFLSVEQQLIFVGEVLEEPRESISSLTAPELKSVLNKILELRGEPSKDVISRSA